MCIIVYKPLNVAFPKKETLEECFKRNDDGAGYMYTFNNKVHIRKGFDNFKSFYNSLQKSIKVTGTDVPYVMHFRISTQAHGRKDCTHPFPLSSKMDDLRCLSASCNIGIAHNGIISLTSSSPYHYGFKEVITYSDTMLFITDYLSLIIKNKNYYKDKNKLTLIERLVESKLAILDSDGHCELIGNFIEDNGIYYSNSSYVPYVPKYNVIDNSKYKYSYDSKFKSNYSIYDEYGYDEYDDYYSDVPKGKLDEAYFEEFYNTNYNLYDFKNDDCPKCYDIEDKYYCKNCSNVNCPFNKLTKEDKDFMNETIKEMKDKNNATSCVKKDLVVSALNEALVKYKDDYKDLYDNDRDIVEEIGFGYLENYKYIFRCTTDTNDIIDITRYTVDELYKTIIDNKEVSRDLLKIIMSEK